MNRDPIEKVCLIRIKDLLSEWAAWQVDGYGKGYPSRVPFAVERVQFDQGRGDPRQMPEDVGKLNDEIEKLAPQFKLIIRAEYLDRSPQKTKAAQLKMSRQLFNMRLSWVCEQLSFAMWGRH